MPAMERARPSKSKKTQPPSMTKFDVWLNQHCTEGEIVTLMLAEHPTKVAHGKVRVNVRLLTVDRYHIYCEIEEFEYPSAANFSFGTKPPLETTSVKADPQRVWHPIWIAKDNIISAA